MIDLILDVEATCWEGGNWRERGSEIIEIGAVICRTGEAKSFMVKPVDNPILSEFCTKLTTITQDQVDTAPVFSDSIADFIKWAEDNTGMKADMINWGSWGFFDMSILEENCKTRNVPLPFSKERHTNVKLFSLQRLGMRSGGVEQALFRLGIPFEGTQHRGIDDAKMINKIHQIVTDPAWTPSTRRRL